MRLGFAASIFVASIIATTAASAQTVDGAPAVSGEPGAGRDAGTDDGGDAAGSADAMDSGPPEAPQDSGSTPPSVTAQPRTEPPPTADGGERHRSASKEDDEGAVQELAPRPSAKGDPFGDDVSGVNAGGFSFRLLLQTRYTRVFGTTNSAEADNNNGYQLNRVFLRGVVHPYKWLSAKLLVDFAEIAYSNPQQALKLAYGEIRPFQRLEITVGLFKRTYSLLELLPIAAYEFAQTGPTDSLIKDAQFGGRDVGVMVRVDPLPKRKWLHVYLGSFGGPGEGAEGLLATGGSAHTGPDLAAPTPLFTARITSKPLKHFTLGADGAWRPLGTNDTALPPASQVTAGKALSADATYSTRSFGLRGEWLWGDRTDTSLGAAETFMAAWALAIVHFHLAGVDAIPGVRFEWLDANRQVDDGQRFLLSGALNLDFTEKVRLLLDLSRQQLTTGTFPASSPAGVFSQSATIFVVQLQLKI